MQNTIIKEFQDNPEVVTAVYQEGGRMGETSSWMRTFWDNYFLRDTVIWDPDGSVGQNYKHPSTGLPFGRGFIIDQDGNVALPYFGHRPELVIETIYELLGYIRGDANGDQEVDISDAIRILVYLFQGGSMEHPGAIDVNGDGRRDLSDVLYLLNYLFRGGAAPLPPFLGE